MDLRCPSCRTEVDVIDGQLLPEYTCGNCGHEFSLTSEPEFAVLVFEGPDGNSVRKDVLRQASLIGSGPGCNVKLVDPTVSPAHCVLTLETAGMCVRDLRSRTGTRVNGSLVDVRVLSDGDTLRVGMFDFRLETNTLNQVDAIRAESRRKIAPFERNEDGAMRDGGRDADASDASDRPFVRLECQGPEQSFLKDIRRPTTLIGSGEGCNIRLQSELVSPAHCIVTLESDGIRVRNLRAATGVSLNGTNVETGWLSDGDEIAVGEFTFRLQTNLKPGGANVLAATRSDPDEFD